MTSTLRYHVIEFIIGESQKRMGKVGHTYLQKLLYILQEVFSLDLGYKFKLYHYGPYSSELLGDIELLNHNGSIAISINPGGFGYNFSLREERDVEIEIPLNEEIEHLISFLSDKSAKELESLATAHFVYKNLLRSGEEINREKISSIVNQLKTHLSIEEIERSIELLETKRMIAIA